MKVRHLSGPKAGTSEHIENSVGRTLIAMGTAVEEKLPPRGSAGWLAARLEQSDQAVPSAHDINPSVPGVEWGVKEKGFSPWSKTTIIKRSGAETFYFTEPPADCPRSIVARFKELTAEKPDAQVVAEAKAAQAAREQAEKQGIRNVIFN